jgi:amidophosphoribosyltransferase
MDRLCRACFDGEYPVALPEPELLGKHLLEGLESRALADDNDRGALVLEPEGLSTLVAGGGATEALNRP